MGGKDQHFCNLYVLRGIGGKDGNVGNVITSKGFDAFIDIGCTIVVATETNVAEVGLHKSGFQIRYADSSVGYVNTQTI